MKPIQIIQASGERTLFEEAKLVHSLSKAGAKEEAIQAILKTVKSHLYEGISTKEIYSLAFKQLREFNHPAAAKYKLKKALLELGPSGFVFEKYISELFKHQGYTAVSTGQILQGSCVTHEVDILATKDNTQNFIECKYHNLPGTVCDVKVPLYFHSRFRDLAAAADKNLNYQGWIITNTKFTTDAATYGTCAGLKLLSWGFPTTKGLKDIIDQLGLYPITCLTTLTQKEKLLLMQENILLCKSIVANKNILSEAGILMMRTEKIANEASALLAAVANNNR